jgi:hypothetical protein
MHNPPTAMHNPPTVADTVADPPACVIEEIGGVLFHVTALSDSDSDSENEAEEPLPQPPS